MQIFEVKSENGKVKGERLEVRGGNKTERHMSAARFGVDMWYCYISSRLADLCAHSIIGFAIAEDDELTVAHYLLDVCVVGTNIINRRCGLGCKLASV